MATLDLGGNANLQLEGNNAVIVGPQVAIIPPPTFTGSLWSWGDNSYGKLGDAGLGDSKSPAHVATNYSSWQLASHSLGQHFAIIKDDGSLWLWGRNNYGQTGLDTNYNYSSPTQLGTETNWASITTGYKHTLASKTDGTLWAWGQNYDTGQLGNNSIGNGFMQTVSSPVMIMTAGNSWSSLSAGFDFSVAVRSDGKLFIWGSNSYGQLGTGNKIHRSSPFQISSDTTWSKAVAGSFFVLALKKDGSLWSWGNNSHGRLGLGNVVHRSSPVMVGSQNDWTDISSASATSYGLRSGGIAYGWGYGLSNAIPQYGTNENKSSPFQIVTDKTWTKICVGNVGVAGISSGAIYTWGINFGFQLGQNSYNSSESTSPTQIYNGDTDWTDLSGGYLFFVAKK